MTSKHEQPWRQEPKIVGGTEKEKRMATEDFMRIFTEQPSELFTKKFKNAVQRLEYKKLPEEERIIDLANKKSNEIAVKYGGVAYDYSSANFHILPHSSFPSRFTGLAFSHPSGQFIALDSKKLEKIGYNRMRLYAVILEELLHLKGYTSIEPDIEPDAADFKFSLRRSGLGAFETAKDRKEDREHGHFTGLEEAVTVELVKNALPEILNEQGFEDEKQWANSSQFKDRRFQIARKKGIPEEEIYWVDRNDRQFSSFGYRGARKVLSYIIEEVKKDNPEMDRMEIFELFARAKFSGEFRPLAKLIKETFGKYGMRVLGMMDQNHSSAINALEFLKTLRRDALESKEKKPSQSRENN